MVALYEWVKEAQSGYGTEEKVIDTFLPKIRKSLRLTKPDNREDLEQELKLCVIHYVKSYSLDEVPGLVDLNQRRSQHDESC
ncbi:hypothetical protein N780_07220 [Pontibacillus chungwhensis BH030062]|uniref:Helix-turn-helix conjugative transposon-like domain-containing protein n=1 Tax=Pontibacillus chungwhensis BH030062 TaxID=1385513 RepID=A0A0A2UU31_9BACI|nr:hypothetical protein [Pontibacillus chungwhensis]KGP90011.1 hypothetical protein N780_07220 [Pontibacillus chungwhensis BH030062]